MGSMERKEIKEDIVLKMLGIILKLLSLHGIILFSFLINSSIEKEVVGPTKDSDLDWRIKKVEIGWSMIWSVVMPRLWPTLVSPDSVSYAMILSLRVAVIFTSELCYSLIVSKYV